jgi:hypothetical protein
VSARGWTWLGIITGLVIFWALVVAGLWAVCRMAFG